MHTYHITYEMPWCTACQIRIFRSLCIWTHGGHTYGGHTYDYLVLSGAPLCTCFYACGHMVDTHTYTHTHIHNSTNTNTHTHTRTRASTCARARTQSRTAMTTAPIVNHNYSDDYNVRNYNFTGTPHSNTSQNYQFSHATSFP